MAHPGEDRSDKFRFPLSEWKPPKFEKENLDPCELSRRIELTESTDTTSMADLPMRDKAIAPHAPEISGGVFNHPPDIHIPTTPPTLMPPGMRLRFFLYRHFTKTLPTHVVAEVALAAVFEGVMATPHLSSLQAGIVTVDAMVWRPWQAKPEVFT